MSNTADMRTSADQVLTLERDALNRWGNGDPRGFLELYASDISYFDPATAIRMDGHDAMADYYRPLTGKIEILRYEMLNPRVTVDGNMALLTYNLVNFVRDANGLEVVGSRWNSTTVFLRRDDSWKSIHSHWSFTRHPALQDLTVVTAEGLG